MTPYRIQAPKPLPDPPPRMRRKRTRMWWLIMIWWVDLAACPVHLLLREGPSPGDLVRLVILACGVMVANRYGAILVEDDRKRWWHLPARLLPSSTRLGRAARGGHWELWSTGPFGGYRWNRLREGCSRDWSRGVPLACEDYDGPRRR